MIWQRLKNLWDLSALPKNSKGYPDEFERGHQAGEMHALQTRMKDIKTNQRSMNNGVVFIPRIQISPVDEIVNEQSQ